MRFIYAGLSAAKPLVSMAAQVVAPAIATAVVYKLGYARGASEGWKEGVRDGKMFRGDRGTEQSAT
jgi:hypothetical protein